MKVLLHICCGPCSIYPIHFLRELDEFITDQADVTGYFYNPNIHPYKEFKRRLTTAREYLQKIKLNFIVDDTYDLPLFLTGALTAEPSRCHFCYEMRLRKAAQVAKEKGFDAFTTSLLVSPFQKHELIKEIGERIAEEEGLLFHYIDFRPGWDDGVAESLELELYRQPYCGCIFSEQERYQKKKKVKA
ncbi:MAG: epoxyqueuosine reductase QueH [Sporomusaceae bacterium]|nr:epoxyqueuosine reductase QueH [Sporomusaceae bacterium]